MQVSKFRKEARRTDNPETGPDDIGAEKNYCPFCRSHPRLFSRNDSRDNFDVADLCRIDGKMSSLSRTMSASLPVVIEPFSLS